MMSREFIKKKVMYGYCADSVWINPDEPIQLGLYANAISGGCGGVGGYDGAFLWQK